MEDSLAQTLQSACASLNRIALEVGADSAAVSLDEDNGAAIVYFWNRTVGSEYTDPPASLVHRAHSVAFVFGFTDRRTVPRYLPEPAASDLDLVAGVFGLVHEVGRLRTEIRGANARFADRKLVERAKGVLQVERGITEQSAYAYLRDQSRRRRIPLPRLAEEVIRIHSDFNRRRVAGLTELTGVNS